MHACMQPCPACSWLIYCAPLFGDLAVRRCVGAQITWRWQGFANPARADGLQLEHWVKCYKDPAGKVKPAEEGEYSFAKYNKKVGVCCNPNICPPQPTASPTGTVQPHAHLTPIF